LVSSFDQDSGQSLSLFGRELLQRLEHAIVKRVCFEAPDKVVGKLGFVVRQAALVFYQ
jgi:hypothetical protein